MQCCLWPAEDTLQLSNNFSNNMLWKTFLCVQTVLCDKHLFVSKHCCESGQSLCPCPQNRSVMRKSLEYDTLIILARLTVCLFIHPSAFVYISRFWVLDFEFRMCSKSPIKSTTIFSFFILNFALFCSAAPLTNFLPLFFYEWSVISLCTVYKISLFFQISHVHWCSSRCRWCPLYVFPVLYVRSHRKMPRSDNSAVPETQRWVDELYYLLTLPEKGIAYPKSEKCEF